MSTQTYTNTDDFSAISNCSVESGSVVPGKYTFADKPASTGLDDFTQDAPGNGTITLNDGNVVLKQNGTTRLLIPDPGTLDGVTNILCDAATNGDFVVRATIDGTGGEDMFAFLLYRVDDTNLVGPSYHPSSGSAYTYKWVGGARTILDTSSVAANLTVKLELERDGNLFINRISTDGGSSWTELSSTTQAFATDGNIVLAVDNNTGASAKFTELEFVSGLTADAEVLINDSGAFVADAGAGNSFDLSTATESTTGTPSVTYKYEARSGTVAGSDAATVDGNVSWNASWLTLAQLQSETDPTDQYLYLKAQLAGADGSGDTLDEFAVDTYTLDVTDPTAPNDPIGYYDDDAAGTYDIPIKLTEGSDTGSAGYAGFNVGLYISGEWRYEQSDGSFAADETFANLEIRGGNASTEYLGWVQSVADSPTQARFTSWDNAGNNSPRTDVVLVDIAQEASAPGTPTITAAAGDGQVTVTVAADTESDEVYIYYRAKSASAWSAQSETFKRTGSGDVTVTGLTNATTYAFQAVAKVAGCYGEPSDEAFATPNDGQALMQAALRTLLAADVDVAALVSGRIYAFPAPQRATLPYLTISRLTGDSEQTLAGRNGVAAETWSIKAFSDDAEQVEELREAVRDAVDAQTGDWSGIVVYSARTTYSDLSELEQQAAQRTIYRNDIELSVRRSEP